MVYAEGVSPLRIPISHRECDNNKQDRGVYSFGTVNGQATGVVYIITFRICCQSENVVLHCQCASTTQLQDPYITLFVWLWPVAGADLLWEKSIAGCLMVGIDLI